MSFCAQCGTPVELQTGGTHCPKCETVNVAHAKFCISCGHQLGMASQSASQHLLQKRYQTLGGIAALSFLVVMGYYYFGFVSPLQGKGDAESAHNHAQPAENQVNQATLPQTEPPSPEEIAEVRSSLEKDPQNFGLNLQMGNLLFDSKRFEDAIPYYRQAISLRPNSPDVIVDLGVSFFNLQKYEEAKSQFELALQANPEHVNALYNMGVIAMQDRQPEKLIQYWTKLQQVAPQSQQAIKAGEILEQIHQNVQQFGGGNNPG